MTDALRKVKQYEKHLEENRYRKEIPVENVLVANADYKTSNEPPKAEQFRPLNGDGTWGTGKDSHAWFHFTLSAAGENTFLRVRTDKEGWDAGNPQFIVYLNGKIRQGADTNHTEILLDAGKETDVYLYGYTGPAIEQAKLFLSVVELNPAVNELYYDILYPLQMLNYLNPESGEYAEILQYLYTAVSKLDWITQDGLTASAKVAHDYLNTEFYNGYCKKQNATVVCIGHTHIDCAWLWTLRQTKEKVQRSFATVLELMKRYPEYKFMSSQPLLYENLKEGAPELYEEVKARVKEGRWEPEGAMWVEPDCNLPSGESLVRQILFGKGFFKQEFGVDNRVLWLPDVFGYSAALPQILKKSGVDWFVTSKISWNDTNQMPCDTFLWKGIDGTGINSYFLTAQRDNGGHTVKHTTYVGKTDAQMISGTYKRYRQKNLNNEVLLTFGFGDGGGGPTAEHLELLRRSEKGVPGSPDTKIGFAGDFLRRLEKKIENNPQLPTWQGELYLEFHRGTYTTQAKNKRNNRKGEFLLQNAELYSVIDKRLHKTAYPVDALHKGWKTLLTNQFHDIIPGSSIREVYEQCDKDYAEVFASGNGILNDVFARIASSVAEKEGYVAFNPNGFASDFPMQADGKTVLPKKAVACKGYSVVNEFETENHIRIQGKKVTTDRFEITFDANWQICSLYDRLADREVIRKGAVGNELRIYADRPDDYDAWEWQIYSRDEYRVLTDVSTVKTVEDGVRKGIQVTRKFQKSTLVQTIWFYDSLEKIDFETKVDWHETHLMLKTAFPVDVNSDFATYEIQFGNTRRPTHFNTEWDMAKFEVCGHKYADLSDGGYGVSLLNDCKYGYDIHDGVMQLSLLRSPTYPDPKADQGEMLCTYSLVPHIGDFASSRTVELAYDLNQPIRVVRATGKTTSVPVTYSVVKADQPNVLCDTVKEAEDGNGTVLRFYECKNKRQNATFTLGIPAKKVFLCDLMENEIEELPLNGNTISCPVKGFEILTVKVL